MDSFVPDNWYGRPVRSGPAHASPSGTPDLDGLRREFPGVCIWYGEASGSLWAMLPNRLIEAKTVADLARQLRNTVGRPRSRTNDQPVPRRPRPSARRPDGTWTMSDSPARHPPRHTCLAHRPRRGIGHVLVTCLRLAGMSALSGRPAL